MKRLLIPKFSPRDTSPNERTKEEATYMFLLDFLEQCEGIPCIKWVLQCGDGMNLILDGEVQTLTGSKVTVEQMLIFFTGTDQEPPLGFPKQPELHFLPHGVLATASTCDLILRLPINFFNEYNRFKEMMIESLVSSEGFGYA